MAPPLSRRFQDAWARLGLGHALGPEQLAVAVSGGVDSTALMHLLVEAGHRPTVVTFDHGLRPESAAECRFVEAQALALGLPCVQQALGVTPGPGVAARARAARVEAMQALPQPRIALAHHRDDQAETVLDRLMRGSGAGGLGAMRPVQGRFVRPLLPFTRAELRAWVEARGLRWVEDPSNTKGTRGALRHRVLPELEAIRENAGAGLARSARLLAMDDALLNALAARLLAPDGVVREAWAAAPEPLQRRAVLSLVREARGHAGLTAAQIDAVLALREVGARVNLPGGWWVALDPDRLRCLPPRPRPQTLREGRWGLWRIDADRPLAVRPPAPGERLEGRPLAESLRASGVPGSLRPYHPVVEVGALRWVPGVSTRPPHPGGADARGIRVRCERVPGPSVPAGGPYVATL
ncbi:MAG: tRNA lysidine(34) synthetase TilS [Alphaproteobacteria bacterium]|nr:tRNA lysidine(34) synthetase TilS [Alphaproteobacteria bacterium]